MTAAASIIACLKTAYMPSTSVASRAMAAFAYYTIGVAGAVAKEVIKNLCIVMVLHTGDTYSEPCTCNHHQLQTTPPSIVLWSPEQPLSAATPTTDITYTQSSALEWRSRADRALQE